MMNYEMTKIPFPFIFHGSEDSLDDDSIEEDDTEEEDEDV